MFLVVVLALVSQSVRSLGTAMMVYPSYTTKTLSTTGHLLDGACLYASAMQAECCCFNLCILISCFCMHARRVNAISAIANGHRAPQWQRDGGNDRGPRPLAMPALCRGLEFRNFNRLLIMIDASLARRSFNSFRPLRRFWKFWARRGNGPSAWAPTWQT